MNRASRFAFTALGLFSFAACGSDLSGGGTGSGDDGGTSDAAVSTADGAADDAGSDGASPAETCGKVGTVRSCKTPAGEGTQTCVEQADHSLVWGHCISVQCDATASTGANEVCVAAGQFSMGGLDGSNGLPLEGDTLPAHTVTIRRRFYVDKFEVSYDEFMAWFKPTPTVVPVDNTLVFVSGNGDELRWHGAANVKAPGTDVGFGCTAGIAANDATKASASINCLTWETALAYCMAHGKRLPTEAEWEFVASGMGANNAYPWGTGAPDNTCSKAIDNDCYQANPTKFPFVRPSAVAGNTNSGINNLAGNEAEWTLDQAPKLGCANDSSCWPAGAFDPLATKDNGTGYVLRGGSYVSAADEVRPKARWVMTAQTQQGRAGFRCVRDER